MKKERKTNDSEFNNKLFFIDMYFGNQIVKNILGGLEKLKLKVIL